MDKKLEKQIKSWAYSSSDSNLIDRVWNEYAKKHSLEKTIVKHESDCLDEDKLFANTIDETLAYIKSLKDKGWTCIEQKWSGYEDNYFVAAKNELETDDEFARRIGEELNELVKREKNRLAEKEATRKEIERLKEKIKFLEQQ